MTKLFSVWAFAIFLLLPYKHASANSKLINMPYDSWLEIPNSIMNCAPASMFPTIQGTVGCAAVTSAWSGGAYDDKQHLMYVWGGGHTDYYGNELYAFNVEFLRWRRLTNPSTKLTLSADPMADGTPASRHTYDGLAFINHAHRFFSYGGSIAGNGWQSSVTWLHNLDSNAWENRNPVGEKPSGNCCNFSGAYDPNSRMVYFRDPNALYSFSEENNEWKKILDWPHSWGPVKSAVDIKRNIFFTVGQGEFLAYDIVSRLNITSSWATSGADTIVNGYGIGLDYDSKNDKLVAYDGRIFTLDLESKQWTKSEAVGGPGNPEANGTYGRFRYVPEYGVFVLINSMKQNVFFYKPANSIPVATKRVSPEVDAAVRKVLGRVDGRFYK